MLYPTVCLYTDVMKKLIQVLLGLTVLAVVCAAGYVLYVNVLSSGNDDRYVDEEYGFVINDTSGWRVIPEREGVYFSMGTVDENDIIVSYLGVSPIVKDTSLSDEARILEFRETCRELSVGVDGGNLDDSEVTIGDMSGGMCSYEAPAVNIDGLLATRQYILVGEGGSEYDYMIFVSYPKDDEGEKENVDRIIESFGVE